MSNKRMQGTRLGSISSESEEGVEFVDRAGVGGAAVGGGGGGGWRFGGGGDGDGGGGAAYAMSTPVRGGAGGAGDGYEADAAAAAAAAASPEVYSPGAVEPAPACPAGWVALWSGRNGAYYYQNSVTNETVWEMPTADAMAADAACDAGAEASTTEAADGGATQ
jgi:hypothetical protein